jgi:Family of unknown function (DUF6491)
MLCAAALAGAAHADTKERVDSVAAPNVAIPFVDGGAIKGWRSGGEDAILIEARSGRWYRGEFRAGCPEVRASETVAFVTSPTGVLDHFSSVLVRDRVCRLRTLTEAPNPRLAAR